jgi:hypothetical protein
MPNLTDLFRKAFNQQTKTIDNLIGTAFVSGYLKRGMLVSSDFSVMQYNNIFTELLYDSREVVFRFYFQIGIQVVNFHILICLTGAAHWKKPLETRSPRSG